MDGLVPTRLVHYVLEDGSIRPFLIVAVLAAETPTHDDPCGQYDKGIVNGILFRDGLNDVTGNGIAPPTGSKEEPIEDASMYLLKEAHKAPLMEWISNVRFDSNGAPGTWKFTQPQARPIPPSGDFVGRIIDRVQDLLNDHAASIKKMLDEAGAKEVPLPPVALAEEPSNIVMGTGADAQPVKMSEGGELVPEAKGQMVQPAKVGKDPWSPDLSYKVGDRVTYIGKDWVAIAASAGVVPGSEGAETFWKELTKLKPWKNDEVYTVGCKVEHEGAEFIATRSSCNAAPGSEDGKGRWSPISGALHAFLESGGGFGSQSQNSNSDQAQEGTAAAQG